MTPRRQLRKSDILRGYQAFSRVIGEGRTTSQHPVRLFVRPDPTLGSALRVGFSVSRTIRSAAHRNRCRRLLREAFRVMRTEYAISGCEIVIMYTGSAASRPGLRDVEPALRRLLSKASA